MTFSTDGHPFRIVLLGKTGSGKSSLGNTLLGKKLFHVSGGISSCTATCRWTDGMSFGRHIQVVDTPGCLHADVDENVTAEIAKCIALSTPGPHAILLTLRCDNRFTAEEYNAYVALKTVFGEAITKHLIIVFTFMDALETTTEDQEEELKRHLKDTLPKGLQEILNDATGRFIGVGNRTVPEYRDRQANKLFAQIEDLNHSNGGLHFSNTLYKKFSTRMDEMIEGHMKAFNCSYEQAEKAIKQNICDGNVKMDFMIKMIGEKDFNLIFCEESVPVFSTCWHATKKFTNKGGQFQIQDSDVILHIPENAVGLSKTVNIQRAVSTDLGKVLTTLSLPEDMIISSPVAEFYAGKHFTFKIPVVIELPHFLPADCLDDEVYICVFEKDAQGCFKIEMNKIADISAVSATGIRVIRVSTLHFSGAFVCRICEKKKTPGEILMRLYGRLRRLDTQDVELILYIWDARMKIKDFEKLVHPDSRIEWYQKDLAYGTPREVSGYDLLVRLDDRVKDAWEIGPVSYPAEKTFDLEELTLCTEGPCRDTMSSPKTVNWLLRHSEEGPRSKEFCRAVIVHCVVKNDKQPQPYLDTSEMEQIIMIFNVDQSTGERVTGSSAHNAPPGESLPDSEDVGKGGAVKNGITLQVHNNVNVTAAKVQDLALDVGRGPSTLYTSAFVEETAKKDY